MNGYGYNGKVAYQKMGRSPDSNVLLRGIPVDAKTATKTMEEAQELRKPAAQLREELHALACAGDDMAMDKVEAKAYWLAAVERREDPIHGALPRGGYHPTQPLDAAVRKTDTVFRWSTRATGAVCLAAGAVTRRPELLTAGFGLVGASAMFLRPKHNPRETRKADWHASYLALRSVHSGPTNAARVTQLEPQEYSNGAKSVS